MMSRLNGCRKKQRPYEEQRKEKNFRKRSNKLITYLRERKYIDIRINAKNEMIFTQIPRNIHSTMNRFEPTEYNR